MHTKAQLDRTHPPPPLNRFLYFPPLRLLLSGTPMPLAFSLSVSLLLTFLQQKTQHRQIFLFFPSSLQWSVLYLQHTQCSPLCGYTKHEIPCSLQSNFHNIKVLELQSVTIVRLERYCNSVRKQELKDIIIGHIWSFSSGSLSHRFYFYNLITNTSSLSEDAVGSGRWVIKTV